ncbi:MAG: penicillin-binding protein 2 [Nocardioides sp.]|nr:penicillin-binding protein 2 [Nocardioides sp.]
MNRPIRTLSLGCLILFIALMLNITWVQFVRAGWYNDRADNRRVTVASFARQRGAILVGKKNIAESVPKNDEYKYQRTYPGGKEYAPLTGFLSYSYGQTGIEKSQNGVLSGDDNRLFTNRLIDLVTNSEPRGGNVELTINPKVQDAAYNGLKELGSDVEGAAVAIEPSTGKVLAMATSPSFDPNKIASHDFGAASNAWNTLNDKNKSPGQPMLNRAIQTRLPPGSTFKLVTASAAMEDLGMTPDSTVPGDGPLDLPQTDKDLPNENGETCGGKTTTMEHALAESCNVSFGSIGLKLSESQLQTQAEKYGFGQRWLTDLPAGGQASSVFYSGNKPTGPFMAYSAIGQYEVAATPLQVAMVSAGIANGGTVMKPYLVDRVTSSSLDVVDQGKPTEIADQPAISKNTAQAMTQMMVNVVQQGTGTPAQIPGVTVAGKTGTAQSDDSRAPYAWFTGFAPAENPTIAVAVMVQKSGTARDDVAGGRLSAPIAKAMMEAAIK